MSLGLASYKRWIIKCAAFNLEKITGPPDYKVTVNLVDIKQLAIHTVLTPAIIVTPTGLSRRYLPGGVMEFTLSYALVPVIDISDLTGAEDIVEALEAFELDIVKCHQADHMLVTAFSTNPKVPEELRSFYLRDHKLQDAHYVFTKNRAHMMQEVVAEYEVVGQANI